jgi:hypothetical protein
MRESSPQLACEERIAFDRRDDSNAIGERLGQPAGAGTDLPDVRVGGERSVADELGRDGAAPKEVPAVSSIAPWPWRAVLDHDGSP